MNEKHPKIKFTIEMERDTKLLFLDLIDKSNDDLAISIYRKQTYTDLGVNFLSTCNMKHRLYPSTHFSIELLNLHLII